MEATPRHPLFPTMIMRRFAGQKVISNSTAAKIARMIVIEECGEAALNAQLPLTISAEGEHWQVLGSRTDALQTLVRENAEIVGPLSMRISQYDGQITDLHYETFGDAP